MKPTAVISGALAGAGTLTLIHESLKHASSKAPRMDLLAMNALSKTIRGAGFQKPNEEKLYYMAMAGDLLSNSLYFSLAGIGPKRGAWLRGTLLGLGAGIGAILLPRPMGLPQAPSSRTTETKALTIALYVVGGLVAGAAMHFLSKKAKEPVSKKEYSIPEVTMIHHPASEPVAPSYREKE